MTADTSLRRKLVSVALAAAIAFGPGLAWSARVAPARGARAPGGLSAAVARPGAPVVRVSPVSLGSARLPVASLNLSRPNYALGAVALSAPAVPAGVVARVAAAPSAGAPFTAAGPGAVAAMLGPGSPAHAPAPGAAVEGSGAYAPIVDAMPAGVVKQTLSSFVKALSPSKLVNVGVGRIFDASRSQASDEDFFVSVGEGEDAPSDEAVALHKEFEAAAQKRLAEFAHEVEQVKAGRIGLQMSWQLTEKGVAVGYLFTLDGAPIAPESLEQTLQAAGISPEEWNRSKASIEAALPGLVKKLQKVLETNEREHQAVHRKMDALARQIALKSVRDARKKGEELQAWGVPIALSVDQRKSLRYAKVYRLDGAPTDLGYALHDLLAPLVAADPAFLSKVTASQLHEAVHLLNKGLRYSVDPRTPDGRKRALLSGGRERHDYPEQRDALFDLARRKLLETPLRGDKPAGLKETPESKRPAVVMRGILEDLSGRFQEMMKSGASDEELRKAATVIGAMHAAMGVPVDTPQGQAMIPVAHVQLVPVLEELRRRKVESEVYKAVIRSFPLGESLLRLGVDKLWAKGVFGQGVKVAIIDNGVDWDHPEYGGISNPVNENFTRDRGEDRKGGHGTPMASIVRAIAPGAEIQSYQALSNSPLPGVALTDMELQKAVLAAMDKAKENGAHIVNLSLGFPAAYSDDPIARKVKELNDAGIVVIVSAGNEGDDLPEGMQIRSPGSSPDAITVGAVDYHGREANFSSEGVVFMPSNNTADEKPNIYAFGVNTKAAIRLPAPVYHREPVPYGHVSGTSPAAPHVAGVAALMLSAALERGADITTAAIPGLTRESLAAGVRRIHRLPVLSNAPKAVKDFLSRVSPQA